VVDFGSGKGYLTFALHDYLHQVLEIPAQVTGVELRQPLVDFCNETARSLSCAGLDFACGDVRTHAPAEVDVMIALHACDIATDYAIHYGIRAGASLILCSPCCHKELRPQMELPPVLRPMLQHGVHLGQQAEMVTDTLRVLLLEAHGYRTKILEFISLEHTDKNKMILAIKAGKADPARMDEVAALKAFYGVRHQTLEELLATAGAEAKPKA
jgi:hypothetical protein